MSDASWGVVRLVGMVLVLGPPVAYYVYRDMSRRDRPHPLAWSIGLGLLSIPGLLFYLHLRGDFSGRNGSE